MSLFPELHKPSASPVDATSIADLRRTPFPLSPLLCRPTVHQAPAAEDLPALLQPLHAAASVTFERAEPVTPPPSSESSQRLSLHIEEDPRSSQCPGDLRPHLLCHHPPRSSHPSAPAPPTPASPKPAPPAGPLRLLRSGPLSPARQGHSFPSSRTNATGSGQCFLTPSRKVAPRPITVTSRGQCFPTSVTTHFLVHLSRL